MQLPLPRLIALSAARWCWSSLLMSDRGNWILLDAKRESEDGVPFAMDPVVYDFSINDDGTSCELLTGDDAMLSKRQTPVATPRGRTRPAGLPIPAASV